MDTVRVAIDETDIGRVRPDQRVTFTVDAYAGRNFEGRVEQIRKAELTVQNVVTYTVIVATPNPDLRLVPGMTANVRIVSDSRDNVLKVANAALRFKPTDQGAAGMPAGGAPAGGLRGGTGMIDDLAAFVATMQLTSEQQAAFDADAGAARARQEEMRKAMEAAVQNAQRAGGGAGGPSGMVVQRGGQGGNAGGQMRQRMLERFQQNFARFLATLDDAQRQAVQQQLASLAGARRVTVYRLESGRPVPVQVRLGASDGSSTEVSGGVKEGDLLVTGERAGTQ